MNPPKTRLQTACWRCLELPMPLEGLERLALCESHLRQRVAEAMAPLAPPPASRRHRTCVA